MSGLSSQSFGASREGALSARFPAAELHRGISKGLCPSVCAGEGSSPRTDLMGNFFLSPRICETPGHIGVILKANGFALRGRIPCRELNALPTGLLTTAKEFLNSLF